MLLLSDLDDIYHMEGLLGLVYIYHMEGLLGLVYIYIILMGCLVLSTIYIIWKGHGCMLWLLHLIAMFILGSMGTA